MTTLKVKYHFRKLEEVLDVKEEHRRMTLRERRQRIVEDLDPHTEIHDETPTDAADEKLTSTSATVLIKNLKDKMKTDRKWAEALSKELGTKGKLWDVVSALEKKSTNKFKGNSALSKQELAFLKTMFKVRQDNWNIPKEDVDIEAESNKKEELLSQIDSALKISQTKGDAKTTKVLEKYKKFLGKNADVATDDFSKIATQVKSVLDSSNQTQQTKEEPAAAAPSTQQIDKNVGLPSGTSDKIYNGIIGYLEKTGGKLKGKDDIKKMVNAIASNLK